VRNWLEKIKNCLTKKGEEPEVPFILVIKPDYNFFPVGLTYVASTLERHGYAYDFIDLSFSSRDDLIDLLKRQYKVVMTGGIVGEFEEIEKICQLSKKISPSSKMILGGLLVRDVSRNVLERLLFDFAVVGEAEDTLPELLKYVFSNEPPFSDLHNIEGVMFRDKNNKLVSNHPRHRVDVGSRKILPSTNIPTLGQWLARTGGSLPVLTGRGCYGKCTFCSPSFRRFQGRPFDDVFDEIKLFSEKLGINMINFTNEVFFEKEEEILSFCAEYREKIKLPFTCALRLDISPKVLSELKKSGCVAVGVGIESASDEVLKKMKKSITSDVMLKFIDAAKTLRLTITSGLMINNEGESEADIDKTLALHESLKVASGLSLTIPYPGTIIHKRAVERGLISDEYDFLRSQQIFYNKVQFLPECLFIVDEAIGKPLLPNLTDIPDDEFVSVMSRAYARFYHSQELKNASLNNDASKIKGQCPKCGIDCEFDFNPISPVVRNLACPGTRDGNCYHAFQFAAHIYGIPSVKEYEKQVRLQLISDAKITIVGDPFIIKFLFAYRIFDICDRNIVAMGNPEVDKIGHYVFYDGYKHVMPRSKLLDIKSLAKTDFDRAVIAYMPPYSDQVRQMLIAAGIAEDKIVQMCPEGLILKG
jgi:radical SAM superfamily enzyme YgiQ (UPF0313 family)